MASPKDAVSPDAPVKAAKEVIITGTFGIYEGSKKHHDIVISTLSEGKANFDPSSLDNTLYEGIQDYLDKKETIKDGYFKQYPPETSPLPNNPTYFRDLLAEYIKTQKHQIEPYKPQDDDIRLKSPEKATIKMEQLLGKQGVALYRLALEEERFSKEYVDAVFVKSRVGVPGEKWDGQRPVVFVAGPSSSGKSVAANAVLAQASQFIKTQPAQEENKKAAENQEAAAAEEEEEEEKFNNYAIFSDGGNERELSQVRKLAIQLAIDNGYTGVKDLETESKVKNKVKSCILNAVENTKTLGIVIPETFSGVVGVTDIIKKFQKDPNNVVMFSRVEGEKPSFFQKIVAYLGARRAFKSSGFDQERDGKLDLNKTGLPESKAYGAGGFKWGKWGSEIAESEFIASKTDTISFIVTNDLILKRYDDKKGQWVDGKEGQNGITLVSNRAFNLWIKENPDSRSIKELEQFNKNNKHTIIHSHGQMDLLKIQIAAERHVAFLQQPKNFNPENLKLRTALEKILEVMPAGLKDGGLKITQKQIDNIQMTLDAYSADLGEKKTKELSSAIDRLSSEARLSSFAATPINLSQTATTQKSIIVDVRSFEGFTTEKLEINSTEYNKGASATESHLEGMQNNGPELHYEGHVLKDNERIVTQAKMSEGTIRLEQDKTGAVRDRSVGNLSSLELQQAALKQAQMILNNYDPQNGKLIIRGKDVEQAQRLYAAVMHLALNNPDLKSQMKSGWFGHSPSQIIECRVMGFKPPGGLERNNEYINRHLPDLKTMKKISENEEVTTLSSNEKQKIDVDLKIKTEADPEKSNSYKVFKDKYKMVVEARNDTKEALAMKEEKAPSVAPPSL